MPTATLCPDHGRIYVASLSDYNAGRLIGRWIDVDPDAETMAEAVEAMLRDADLAYPLPYGQTREETAIHDTDGPIGAFGVTEYTSLSTIAAVAEACEGHPWIPPAVVAHIAGEIGTGDALSDTLSTLSGPYDSIRDAAETHWHETTGDHIRHSVKGHPCEREILALIDSHSPDLCAFEQSYTTIRIGSDVWAYDATI